ncbi:hypothetical protein quinque_007875 [Culex quinquefasciatus]
MSLVWSLIASFLYVEIFIVLMLVLPVASPQRWQRFFKSRFLAMLSRQAQTYFYLLLFVLVLFLLEAIREMRKYSHNGKHPGDSAVQTGNTCRADSTMYEIYEVPIPTQSEAVAIGLPLEKHPGRTPVRSKHVSNGFHVSEKQTELESIVSQRYPDRSTGPHESAFKAPHRWTGPPSLRRTGIGAVTNPAQKVRSNPLY